MAVIRDVQLPYQIEVDGAPLTNGSMNRQAAPDAPFHNWYRFVLSFPSHLVRHYVDEFGIGTGDTVLDPFCGTGTTLVECMKLGVASVGLEAHPMAHFAASVKTRWDVDAAEVMAAATAVRDDVRASFAEQGIGDVGRTLPASLKLRELPEAQKKLLIGGSIDPLPLHRTLILRNRILDELSGPIRDLLLLALASALPTRIGNLHFGPEVGVRGSKGDVDVCKEWLGRVERFAADLSIAPPGSAAARVFRADSRSAVRELGGQKLAAVITSPPYPNEKDYTRTTRLESVILGFIGDRKELQAVKKGLVRSNTRGVYAADDDGDHVPAGLVELEALADEIERRRVAMGKTSGFERMYPRVVRHYFGGMARHLESMSRVMQPGGNLAYVVGDQASYLRVMIRTGQILSRIAEKLGYETERIDLFRTRWATATRAELREEVVVLRWPG